MAFEAYIKTRNLFCLNENCLFFINLTSYKCLSCFMYEESLNVNIEEILEFNTFNVHVKDRQ